ncbi:MAG TPA: OmpH family outer membrane protein [Spirochaetota bacterium]|nr:OmpH family outer membrane protein [Spirochaetota bacterium]HOL56638.1 OmpH family outer membrane protein [Spirochaetota bacterium]HPP03728.1 OmpH family outer membrane protein [Spirochaetota bacterium]
MKKIFFALFTFIGISFVYSTVQIDKIGVINLDLIIETVFSGKSKSIQDIKKEKEEFQSNLKKLEENIMKYNEAKLKESDETKKLAIQKKIEELKQQYNEYYKVKSYQIEQKINNIKGPILKEIYDVVKRIADTDGYSIILDVKTEGLFYYYPQNDITQKVIDYFNNN